MSQNLGAHSIPEILSNNATGFKKGLMLMYCAGEVSDTLPLNRTGFDDLRAPDTFHWLAHLQHGQ